MFEDDARLAPRGTWTHPDSRNTGAAAEVPLAGVPGQADEYLRRLIPGHGGDLRAGGGS